MIEQLCPGHTPGASWHVSLSLKARLTLKMLTGICVGKENDDDTDLRDMMADKDDGISWCHSVGV